MRNAQLLAVAALIAVSCGATNPRGALTAPEPTVLSSPVPTRIAATATVSDECAFARDHPVYAVDENRPRFVQITGPRPARPGSELLVEVTGFPPGVVRVFVLRPLDGSPERVELAGATVDTSGAASFRVTLPPEGVLLFNRQLRFQGPCLVLVVVSSPGLYAARLFDYSD